MQRNILNMHLPSIVYSLWRYQEVWKEISNKHNIQMLQGKSFFNMI
jgi:hypothetical protein